MSKEKGNYFIDKKFQTRWMLKILFFSVISSLLTIVLVIGFFYYSQVTSIDKNDEVVQIKGSISDIDPDNLPTPDDLTITKKKDIVLEEFKKNLWILLPTLIVAIIIEMILILIVGLMITNKLARPIYNFERHLLWLTLDDYSNSLEIEEGDEFKNLGYQIDNVRKSLNNKFKVINELILKLEAIESIDETSKDIIKQIKNKLPNIS